MEEFVWMALLATLGTWLVTALGAGLVVFFAEPNRKLLNGMLGFAAGVMIAASFWSLLQPAIERAEAAGGIPAYWVATAGFLLGAVFMWCSDKVVTAAQRRFLQVQQPRLNRIAMLVTAAQRRFLQVQQPRLNRIAMLVLSITLHNIPEGLAVGVAFGALQRGCTPEALMGAVSVAVGIGLQNFPEGAAVSVPLVRFSGDVRRRR